METVTVLGRLLLASVFALAGMAKLVDRPGSEKSLTDFGLPALLARPVAVLLPLAELLCAIALIPAATARWGAIGVFSLLVLFVIAIGASLARGRAPNCHCFGQLHSEPVGWSTLVRNMVLAAIAATIIRVEEIVPDVSIGSWAADIARDATSSTVVALVALVVSILTLYLLVQVLRQNGRLLLRLEALEAKLGMVATAPAAGLAVDSPAPAFSLPDLDGGTVTLDSLRDNDKPTLLVFSEPGCGACDLLLPDVARWQHEHADRLTTIVISRGTLGQNRNKRAKLDLKTVLLQTDREVAEAYHVLGTPSAVLVSDNKISRPTAVGPDAIRNLVSDLTAVRVRRGDPAPNLTLLDLHGDAVDLGEPRRGQTLLVFWNPSCGFCQQMLDALKAWELGPSDTPDMLVISTGSVEASAKLGFRSRVLLDDDFKAGQMLGVTGTPSAILLDERNRVASEVAVGKEPVLALANGARLKRPT